RDEKGHFYMDGAKTSGNIRITYGHQQGLSEKYEISIEAESGLGIYFNPVSKVNSPEKARQFDEAWEGAAAGRHAFSFSADIRFSETRADISWVRAAYLVAFSVFGWRYIL